MFESILFCLILIVGIWIVSTVRRRLFEEQADGYAEDLAAFANMPLAGEERRRVAEIIQQRHCVL